MRRFVDPAIVAFSIALIVSIGLHLPAYEVLGVLADRLLGQSAAPHRPTEIEFQVTDGDEGEPPSEPPAARSAADESPSSDAPDRARDETRRERDKARRPRVAKKKPSPEKKETEVEVKKAEPVPRSQPDTAHALAVKQHSQNPDAKPPEHARFIAKENSRVEEESVARLRNDVRDDAQPSPGPAHVTASAQDEVGSANETDVAEMREMEGSDARRPTPDEAQEKRPEKVAKVPPSPTPSGVRGRGREASREPGAQGKPGEARRAQTAVREQAPREAAPQGEPDALVVDDGYGTITVPRASAGERASTGGQGSAATSQREREAREARAGRRGSGNGGNLDALGTTRKFAWSELQNMYGQQRLEDERQAYLRERKSKRRGSNRQAQWRKFRAAIENFVPNVKPGNQTALNAAASPFAEYISDIHRRIHREFSGKFLASLPTWSSSPFADQTLKTQLEIILNRDGTVHRVGVVESSGFLPFDYGAFAAVMAAQPYPEPPLAILSGDGRVYLHWGFYRNARQCGTFNAEPFILPNPPGTPSDHGGPLQDEPNYGGVVPDGAQPTWGTESEKKEDGSQPDGESGGDEGGGENDGKGNGGGGGSGGDGSHDTPAEPPRKAPPSGSGAVLG